MNEVGESNRQVTASLGPNSASDAACSTELQVTAPALKPPMSVAAEKVTVT